MILIWRSIKGDKKQYGYRNSGEDDGLRIVSQIRADTRGGRLNGLHLIHTLEYSSRIDAAGDQVWMPVSGLHRTESMDILGKMAKAIVYLHYEDNLVHLINDDIDAIASKMNVPLLEDDKMVEDMYESEEFK